MKAILLALGLASLGLPALAGQFEAIERGRALATLGDCAACHTAGAGDYAGGLPLQSPFGAILSSNITPDAATGIGTWSRADFLRAVKQGVSKDGRHLYPAMPYTDYVNMSDADVGAIYDYLMSIQPVAHAVDADTLPFPFDQRWALGLWKRVNETGPTWAPVAERSEDWNRGRYIVMGAGHCAACHSPRNLTFGEKGGADFLTGGTLDDWHAPDITPDPVTGIGAWSAEDIVSYLGTGTNAFDTASGPMADEVRHSSSQWSDADLRAVAAYLTEGEPGRPADAPPPAPLAADAPSMMAGAAIYGDRCGACHATDGAGVPMLYPKLAGAPLVQAADPTSLLRVILAGSQAGATPAAPTGPVMPSFGAVLDDAQVAAVADYIRNSWGNAAPKVGPDAARDLRAALGK
ncbi:MAG: alcohol dehydrogenase [Rhodovulum sulfidophilum]|uniref:Alcohol dehydrogenase n=1 Tax=Rhodovulum sulfidophilum TaxID=35806 RepID=A0A2W5N4E8_RHOSU|nr:MAG: alcohol dehydrogenase [Rhodovulum sulfidophilum]